MKSVSLTPSCEIALRAHLAGVVGGKYEITLDECVQSLRRTFPILGRIVERGDIAKQLQSLKFYRHPSKADAFEFRDKSPAAKRYRAWRAG